MKHKFASTTLLLSLIIFAATIQSSYAVVWSPDERLTADTRINFFPSITQSDDGTIWMVWHSLNTSNFDIFCKNSSDNGQTWSLTTQLTTNSRDDKFPSITQAADGKLWVVWSSDRDWPTYPDIWCKTYNGTTWSPATLLASHFFKVDESPSITRTADGKLWVVWSSNQLGPLDIWYTFSSDNGTTWDGPHCILNDWSSQDMQPSIAGMLDGMPWVVWVSGDDLFYSTYEGPLTWSSKKPLTDTLSLDWHPSIIQLGNGEIWVVWDSRLNASMQSELYYMSSSDDGSHWSSPIQITNYVLDDDMPSILQAEDGPIWLAWESERSDKFDIYYRYSILGDVNGDGTIDLIDLGLLAEAYGSTSTSPNPNADVNIDGVVDIFDIAIASANLGK